MFHNRNRNSNRQCAPTYIDLFWKPKNCAMLPNKKALYLVFHTIATKDE